LRRFIISSAAAVLFIGGVAVAASGDFNSYTASETFSPSIAGSPANPSPLAIGEHWTAHGNGGHQTAPLTRIVAKMYGIQTNGKDFPTCTAAKINAAGNSHGWNHVCPRNSLVASGPVHALFVAGNQPMELHPPQCNPYLYIYNGGQGTQVFFFTEYPYAPSTKYTCLNGAVKTGAAAAYNGYITQPSAGNGNTWMINIPLPANVSTSAGGIPNNYASLVKLDVNYRKLTMSKNGRTIAYGASIGCKNGTRPYSFTFYAQNYKGQSPPTQTTTVAHAAACS
jgi:hypothetical protein